MCSVEGIFSLRIVTADFYMEKPKHGLDPCFSELRSKEIKKLPIIRIFGSNAEGRKCCMHVHGIFPYLYIPYDKKDFETLDKAIYLIASSIDKAINVSLGQGSSGSQHVFKVQLVKGIPFYGYHQKEHQYLKIYMLNPRFIRRTANLLQNGAIMGKIFQPHESHVPYILQFFIDYNLYGMSFLHVPNEVLKFRLKDEQDVIPYPTQKGQILDCNVAAKQSTSELELDIGSGFILNRFQLIAKQTSAHTNPGIESIWQDERVRRQKLSKECDEVPPLEIPTSQERLNVKPTESENFYRTGLISKLQQMDVSMDQTVNTTLQTSIVPKPEISTREKKRTFNLKKLIANAVYPEECSQDDVLTNASFIADHLSNRSVFHTSAKYSETPSGPESDDTFLDDTIVDEELVLSLTQPDVANQTLRGQDLELLDVMQQLEEREGDNEIDLDSTLAPLSQNLDLNVPPKAFDSPSMDEETTVLNSPEDDSDNECINDFSIVLDDMDELLLKLSQPSQSKANVPSVQQFDGADDILRTPKKNQQRTVPTTPKTPTAQKGSKLSVASPRTPNSVAKKYAPLPLIIQSRSLKKNLSEGTKQIEFSTCSHIEDNEIITRTPEVCKRVGYNERKLFSLRKKLALTELRRKSVSTEIELMGEDTPISKKRRKTIDLDRTHITCNLRTPRRKNEKRLKVETIESPKADAGHSECQNVSPAPSSEQITTECSKINKLFAPKERNASKSTNALKPDAAKSPRKSNEVVTREYLNSQKTTSPKNEMTSFIPKENTVSSIKVARVSPRVLLKKNSGIKDPLGETITDSDFLVKENKFFKRKRRLSLKRHKKIDEKTRTLNEKNSGKDMSSSDHPEEISSPEKSPIKKRLATRSSVKKDNNASSGVKIRTSPRVLLRRSPIKINKFGKEFSIDHNIEKVSAYSIKKENKLSTKYNNKPTILKNADSSPDFPHKEEPGSECQKSSEVSLKKSKLSTQNNAKPPIKSKVHDAAHDNKISPRVVIKKCPRIKSRLSLRSHKNKDKREKESLTKSVEEACSLSISTNTQEPNVNNDLSPPTNKTEKESWRPKKLRIRLKRVKSRQTMPPKEDSNVSISPKTPTATKKPYSIIVDKKYEIIPIAGPSHLDRFKIINISTPHTRKTPKHSSDYCDLSELEEDDPIIHSFYEKSFVVDSPSVFSEVSVPSPIQLIKCNQQVHSPSADKVVIITPHILPETYEEVAKSCSVYGIPDMVHQQPFYSNYADVTQRKEVGHTVLCIPGRSLNDIEEFQSSLPGIEGFNAHRKKMMQVLGPQFRNDYRIREYLSTERTILITPCRLPPTKQDAKVWLKAREILKEKSEKDKNFEEDSPIKIRRQKVVMMMENESGESGEDMDCSMRSLLLTPLTPIPVRKTEALKAGDSTECTPLAAPKSQTKSVRRRSLLRAKVSLSQKLKDICISNALEKCSGEDVTPTIKCIPRDNLLNRDEVTNSQESSQSNETINSEAVLAELEKSSFVKNLHGSQGSFDTSFGLSIATLNNTFGFKINLENLQQAKSDIEHNFLTTLSLEVFVSTREDLLPDPQFDAILCIFYAIENSIPSTCTEGVSKIAGFIIVADDGSKTCPKFNGINSDVEIKVVANELDGLVKLLELCAHWDPDIFVGYEIEMSSWGYVMERAKYLDFNIAPLLSRVPSQKVREFIDEDRDQLTDLDVETKLCGRILLDVWRLMRSEIALTSYTFENVMYHILHRRCPRHTHKDLSQWFAAPQTRWIVLEYYLERVKGTLELLDQLDLIGRTSEMAKLIGIQFYEVLSRGSQFRVESMMLRIAKPKNLVPLSPSVQQRAHMRAPEYLPLILEPQSRFYPDPVIVLDFQSLYPSMIMAYNYCFSTCLGRVEHLGQSAPFEFGASHLRVSPTLLRKLLDNQLVTISPCGVVYVKREIREGILPRMLSEVLDTRQMVKQSMKLHKNSTALQRILHSRQLGLKLIANVTYGYTAANFSGRMPCVEVGDSVVAKGRETLERAIKLVEANEQWRVRVVYGDTDSLFVQVPGRSREEAFKIGAEIAELVTQDNPQPVKLKLEKVYQPCILQTKKRYVGYMYESPDQEKPIYEAKGIETVRRDGCPAAAKMLEKCLRILFESADVSHVKSYVCRQFTKLLSGKANIQDLIFAKEFRGLNGYKPTACVPALELTRKWMQTDPRKIPRRGERVPFIVTNGPPGLPLIKLVRSPHDVLADEGLKINAIYYITKAIIPPLNRCFLLIGADVNEWFTNLPRKILFTPALSTANEIIATNASKKSTISQYFSSTNCIIDCGRQTKQGICTLCSVDTIKSIVTLEEKISKLERGYHLTQMICQACCGRSNFINCASLDCPVLYVLEMKRRELPQIKHIQSILDERY